MLYNSKVSIGALALALLASATYAADVNSASQQPGVKSFAGESLAKNAKITMVDARAIALKAHPGTITDEELENESGGSGLRYSFDIKDAKGTQEVGVDAKTGKVLENKREEKNPD